MSTRFPITKSLLTEGYYTATGKTVRALVWSMADHRTSINLWNRIGDLGPELRAEMAILIGMESMERERAVDELLNETGERERIEKLPLPLMAAERRI
jgi:hypothetical protein